MNCFRCGGLIWDFGDDLGPRCLQCGRSAEPPVTVTELRAAGISDQPGRFRENEMQGRQGRGREYSPHHLGLVRPLATWRR